MNDYAHNTEVWKTIAAAPAYAVSNFGRVARISGGQGARPLLRKQDLEHTGYYRVRLSQNGKQLRFSVHRLVAIAFLGDPPSDRHQVAHYGNDKTNNHVLNLRWATCAENIRDKQRHGTQAKGEKQARSKLTNDAVIHIRNSSDTSADLARKYGVSWSTIDRVRKHHNWAHI